MTTRQRNDFTIQVDDGNRAAIYHITIESEPDHDAITIAHLALAAATAFNAGQATIMSVTKQVVTKEAGNQWRSKSSAQSVAGALARSPAATVKQIRFARLARMPTTIKRRLSS